MDSDVQECLGLGPTAFRQMRVALEQKPEGQVDVEWKGKLVSVPVFLIDICHLRYNLFNTRILPHHKEYISRNGLDADYFERIDKDSMEAQKLIHGFLRKNTDRKAAFRFFKDENLPIRQEPLVSTIDGRVLNGNQRLNVFRQLVMEDDPKKYKHLKQAFVAFLPDQGSADDERDLEATFQDQKLGPDMFGWIQQGNWIIDNRKNRTAAQIGKQMGKSVEEINRLHQQIKLAEEFLEFVGKPNYWVWLDQLQVEQGFKTLTQKMASKKTKEEREKLKKIAFKLMQDPKKASKGKKAIHLIIIDVSDTLHKYDLADSQESEKTKTKSTNDLLKPLVSTKKTQSDVKLDIDEIDPSKLAEEVIQTKTIQEGERLAENAEGYAKKQLKRSVTTYDNILKNFHKADKKGMKVLVNKAIHRLEQIRDKL